jgi:hypothetical protein
MLAVLLTMTASAASPPSTSTGRGTLRLVDQSAYPLAACLDGSPPAFYLRPGTSEAGRSKWVVFHEGGDFCGYGDTWPEWVEDCRKVAVTHTTRPSAER